MATDRQVRDALIDAFRILREQHDALYSLLVEVSAICDSLDSISRGKYEAVLARQWVQHSEGTKPSAYVDRRKFDEIIQRLKALH